MVLPKELLEILTEAQDEVLKQSTGELILPLRKKIWKEFGEFKIGDKHHALITVGLKRRTRLAIICVKRIMNFWDDLLPQDRDVMDIIYLVERYLSGDIDREPIVSAINEFMTKLDNLRPSEKYSLAQCVGFATIRTAVLSLNDEVLIVCDSENSLDKDYDPYDWDAAYHASMAYSGGGIWQPKTSIEKRREFWLWYINEAVSQAFFAYEK